MRDQPFVLMLDERTAARDAETDHALSSAALELLVDAAAHSAAQLAAHRIGIAHVERAQRAGAGAARRDARDPVDQARGHRALPDAPVPGLPGVTALARVTAFLAELRRAIVEASNLEVYGPLEAMVAVPASAASRQRWLTLEAFRRAGFSPIGLVNEPTAAAIEFAHRHLQLGKRSPKRYVVSPS